MLKQADNMYIYLYIMSDDLIIIGFVLLLLYRLVDVPEWGYASE